MSLLKDLCTSNQKELSRKSIETLNRIRSAAMKSILSMVHNAGSGHLGGCLSSLDLLIMLYLCGNIRADNQFDTDRDMIVVSHGHVSAALYTVLGLFGFIDLNAAVETYRKAGSIFEGHPQKDIPGVEWASGSLGQGLSVGCGFAFSAKLRKSTNHVFVLMGDGEQQKGQIHEAMNFAAKYRLNNLTAIIDYNKLQASGTINDIMPQDIAGMYSNAGFEVYEIDGHDYAEIFEVYKRRLERADRPSVIFARTVMGKGVPKMENDYRFHGSLLGKSEYNDVINGLDVTAFELPNKINPEGGGKSVPQTELVEYLVKMGKPRFYPEGADIDARTAFGTALLDIFDANLTEGGMPLVAIDCDLVSSVRLNTIRGKYPEHFIECGIQEHNAATVAAALSKDNCLTFLSDFAVFGLDEVYSQHRMGDMNDTSLKLILTHIGVEVGEDGKSHQCIDYISLAQNLFGYKLIIPADCNQIDKAVRYIAGTPGNFILAIGRNKMVTHRDAHGGAYFGESYRFEYGISDWLREGNDGTIITCGNMTISAVRVSDRLRSFGVKIGVLNLSCPKAIAIEDVRKAADTGLLITWEDHNVHTGIGSIVSSILAEDGIPCRIKKFGVKKYGISAGAMENIEAQGMSEAHVEGYIRQNLEDKLKGKVSINKRILSM
jgi:transketolase